MPFTKEEFLNVFVNYNNSVWPVQIILNALALAAIYFCFKKTNHTSIYVSIVLTFLWLWTGIIYHILFFSTINKVAYLFGILFIIQSGIFFYNGVIGKKLSFAFKKDKYSWWGILLILYGLIIYPVLGYFLGHVYPESPTFGLPCPTTIFTFGLLLLTDKPVAKYILTIPVVWSLIGFFAALNFGIREDIGLLVSCIIAVITLIVRDKKPNKILNNA